MFTYYLFMGTCQVLINVFKRVFGHYIVFYVSSCAIQKKKKNSN